MQVDSKNLDGEPMPHEKYGLFSEGTEDFVKNQVTAGVGEVGVE